MTELISIIALCTSVLLLIVHYRNQIERRHGEIAKLRSDLIQRLSSVYHSLMSMQMHLETIRIELRRTRECDDKYRAIEMMPSLIECAQDAVQQALQSLNKLEGLDTMIANRGKTLMSLQSMEHNVHTIEEMSNGLAKKTLEITGLIELIHCEQEEDDGEKAELFQLRKFQPVNSADPKIQTAD